MPLRALRLLDFAVLVIALPVFVVAGLPLLGWAAAAGAWTAQRGVQALLERRLAATGDPHRVTAVLGVSMIVRGWFLLLCILFAGLAEREAGLSAALLALVLITIHLTTVMIGRPVGPAAGRR
jgi:hypothetical protein